VAFVFDQKITSLLATSGMLAMIIGLAIQVNISNVFSGLAINIERPFRVGDWVKIADFEEGKVLDVTWRATRIETADNCVLNIPNSLAAESVIHNYCYPDSMIEASIEVSVSAEYPPEQVEKVLLDAVLSTQGILRKPEPSAELKAVQQRTAIYTVTYSASNYRDADALSSAVWKRVWIHLNHAEIAPAVPSQNVHIFRDKDENKIQTSESNNSLKILNKLSILHSLPYEEKQYLAQKLKIHTYTAGDIIRKGNINNALFIIAEGVLSLWVEFESEKLSEVLRLDIGDFFDESELGIGKENPAVIQSVTNSQLFEIAKEDITPLMEKYPTFFAHIKTALAKRRSEISYFLDSQEF